MATAVMAFGLFGEASCADVFVLFMVLNVPVSRVVELVPSVEL